MYHNIKRTLVTTLNSTTGYSGFIPEQLVMAPQDLRTADPVAPQYFEQGQFTLGGHTVLVRQGESLFTATTPNNLWHRELHRFGWLRHFEKENFIGNDNLAQKLVGEWIDQNKTVEANFKWDIDITAQRLIFWLCHSIVIQRNAEPEFHEDFMRSIGVHIRHLHRHAATASSDLARLYAHLALIYSALCRENFPSDLDTTERRLSNELDKQISGDGCHINRNPETILELLALLLPLKETYAGRERSPPEMLDSMLSRLFLGLKFFRMSDGSLARFNGTSVVERDLLSTVLRYDDHKSNFSLRATESNYERLQIGQSILIMDVGAAPNGPLSETCHAGCLSFEFSSGVECIIVNSGAPQEPSLYKESVWRKTACHSAAVLNDTSSCKFDKLRKNSDPYSGQLVSNKLRITAERDDTEASQRISASHLGYVREFGARHERRIELANGGKKLNGVEWFSGPDKGDLRYSTRDGMKVHFHLHPDVTVAISKDGELCVLTLRSGKQWQFTAQGFTIAIEDSTYFSNHSGPRKSLQIVVSAKISNTPEIGWVLEEIQ